MQFSKLASAVLMKLRKLEQTVRSTRKMRRRRQASSSVPIIFNFAINLKSKLDTWLLSFVWVVGQAREWTVYTGVQFALAVDFFGHLSRFAPSFGLGLRYFISFHRGVGSRLRFRWRESSVESIIKVIEKMSGGNTPALTPQSGDWRPGHYYNSYDIKTIDS